MSGFCKGQKCLTSFGVLYFLFFSFSCFFNLFKYITHYFFLPICYSSASKFVYDTLYVLVETYFSVLNLTKNKGGNFNCKVLTQAIVQLSTLRCCEGCYIFIPLEGLELLGVGGQIWMYLFQFLGDMYIHLQKLGVFRAYQDRHCSSTVPLVKNVCCPFLLHL